jgi:tetratricopeptide (TPR) repeat protein
MNYTQAHIAYQKAFHVAEELDNPELMSSALAREGVTLIQQNKPKQAIIYLDGALNTIEEYNFPKLKGHILQALSEANAKAQRSQDCWSSIGQAEEIKGQPNQEHSLTRFNSASLQAQRGINTLLLGNYQDAITILDRSLTTYDPAIIRGRARIIAQKAEAYYGLGAVNECIINAKEALTLARSAGSSKTIDRVRNLHKTLEQSEWGKDQGIAQLGEMLKAEECGNIN